MYLIEDCAHAIGVEWNGKHSGHHGTIAAISSQSYKMLNSGEGMYSCGLSPVVIHGSRKKGRNLTSWLVEGDLKPSRPVVMNLPPNFKKKEGRKKRRTEGRMAGRNNKGREKGRKDG